MHTLSSAGSDVAHSVEQQAEALLEATMTQSALPVTA